MNNPTMKDHETQIYIYVPFVFKDTAKKLDAKWNTNKGSWYMYSTNKFKDFIMDMFKSTNKSIVGIFIQDHNELIDEYHNEVANIEKNKICKLCNKLLQSIGDKRKNGKDHPDWDSRQYHKKCFKQQ